MICIGGTFIFITDDVSLTSWAPILTDDGLCVDDVGLTSWAPIFTDDVSLPSWAPIFTGDVSLPSWAPILTDDGLCVDEVLDRADTMLLRALDCRELMRLDVLDPATPGVGGTGKPA